MDNKAHHIRLDFDTGPLHKSYKVEVGGPFIVDIVC